jgi:hypothetical protein
MNTNGLILLNDFSGSENFERINFEVFLLLNSVKSLFLSHILRENIKPNHFYNKIKS